MLPWSVTATARCLAAAVRLTKSFTLHRSVEEGELRVDVEVNELRHSLTNLEWSDNRIGEFPRDATPIRLNPNDFPYQPALHQSLDVCSDHAQSDWKARRCMTLIATDKRPHTRSDSFFPILNWNTQWLSHGA